MNRFIPYEKLFKKKKKEPDSAKRGAWKARKPRTVKRP
jgi:hypothetical protein